MASILDTIFTRLHDDDLSVPTEFATKPLVGALQAGVGYLGYLQGGIYKRELRREQPAATPDAFYTNAYGDALRPSAVLRDRGDVLHPQSDAIPAAFDQFLSIYFYAPGTETGRQAIHDAHRRTRELLNKWVFWTEYGTVGFVAHVDRFGVSPSEEFLGAIYDYCRYRITSRYANEV